MTLDRDQIKKLDALLEDIAQGISDKIEQSTGEPYEFALLLWNDDGFHTVSTVSDDDAKDHLSKMLAVLEAQIGPRNNPKRMN